MNDSMDSVQRFTSRADVYARYRPGYPAELVQFLEEVEFLRPGAVLADVGSGTGKLSQLLLDAGYTVWGIEPNDAMRAYAEKHFAHNPRFVSIAASAESTGLQDASFDMVVAGQAFHWFEPDEARKEFQRVLRPPYRVAIIRNDRQPYEAGFSPAYDALVERHCHQYRSIRNRYHHGPTLEKFFRPNGYRMGVFPHEEKLDWEALRGRLLSSSYVPWEGPVHDALFSELRILFDEYKEEGQITFCYDTLVFYGCLGHS